MVDSPDGEVHCLFAGDAGPTGLSPAVIDRAHDQCQGNIEDIIMAKSQRHTTTNDGSPDGGPIASTNATIHVAIPAGLILSYGDWVIDAATASPATLAYCLQNGFHQSMVDAAALSKDDKAGKSDKEIEAMSATLRTKRFDAIVAGIVGHRSGGPRAKGIDVYIRDLLDAQIVEKYRLKAVPLPSGKGSAVVMQKHRDMLMSHAATAARIRAKAAELMAEAQSSANEVDIFDTADVAA